MLFEFNFVDRSLYLPFSLQHTTPKLEQRKLGFAKLSRVASLLSSILHFPQLENGFEFGCLGFTYGAFWEAKNLESISINFMLKFRLGIFSAWSLPATSSYPSGSTVHYE